MTTGETTGRACGARGRRRECSSERRRHRDRSVSVSRERRSSHRPSRRHISRRNASRSRSKNRSRSRERSGRSRRRRHGNSRSRSRSKSHERNKRRRRDSREDTKARRKPSASDVKDRNAGQERADGEKATQAASAPRDVVADAGLKTLSREENTGGFFKLQEAPQKQPADEQGDVVMADNEEVVKQELQPATSSVVLPAVGREVQSHVVLAKTQENAHNQGEAATKTPESTTVETAVAMDKAAVDPEKQSPPAPVVDVSSIKMDILKALAEARSTIAGIKQNASTTSVSKPIASTQATETAKQEGKDADVEASTVNSPQKQKEMAPSPRKAGVTAGTAAATAPATASSAEEFDMFSMAALDADDVVSGGPSTATVTVSEASLQSNCDDPEGYYSTTVGEVLNGKYRVLGAVGKGVFSTVLRCQCLQLLRTASGTNMATVAVKLIRNNDVMRDAAQTEMKVLKELSARDPRDKKHCIRLLDSFAHRNHVAMVFEPMQMNLREAMKKFGGKSGISIQAVRVFSKHLLIALNHLESCAIIHADIKPDNILLDEKQTTIKLCDFGSAFKVESGKQDPTPYLVSRFYRAPEIVLGLAYDKAVDMWSVGCCLFEMFTGKVLFPGSTNNEMLKLFMELKGRIPNKLIKRHRQAYIDQFEMEPHFTEDLKFCSRESDRVTGKPILRLMEMVKAKNDLASSLMAAKTATDDRKQVLELRSLLDRMFTLDPSKRISVRDALAHPFVKG